MLYPGLISSAMPPPDEAKEESERHWKSVAFRGAVERGQFETVEEMLAEGINPNYKPEGASWSVLMIAADKGHLQLVQRFVKGTGRMPKVDEQDANGFQAIMMASAKGHLEITKLLLEKGADSNAKCKAGETSLMMAAAMGHVDVVRALLEANADPNEVDSNEMNAVKKAARAGNVDCLKLLLERMEPEPRLLKQCLLFGKLNGHPDIVAEMQRIIGGETPDAVAA